MVSSMREIGSEFHDLDIPEGEVLHIPNGTYYATGRIALKQLFESLSCAEGAIWLPAYFCNTVRRYLERAYLIRVYQDSPLMSKPDWATLCAQPGDVVLIVNYFGLRAQVQYGGYLPEGVIVVEDHTHDPISCWVNDSDADYCIASLRKVLPISDGAVLWSPKDLSIPTSNASQWLEAAAQKKIAMSLKRDYLAQSVKNPELKNAFRMLQLEGERQLGMLECKGMSTWSAWLVERGYPHEWINRRRENYSQLLQGLRRFYPYDLGYLPTDLSCKTPLGLPLFLSDQDERDALRLCLNAQEIYCAVHWPSQHEKDLASRELTLLVDQRYTLADMKRALGVARAFFD